MRANQLHFSSASNVSRGEISTWSRRQLRCRRIDAELTSPEMPIAALSGERIPTPHISCVLGPAFIERNWHCRAGRGRRSAPASTSSAHADCMSHTKYTRQFGNQHIYSRPSRIDFRRPQRARLRPLAAFDGNVERQEVRPLPRSLQERRACQPVASDAEHRLKNAASGRPSGRTPSLVA